MEKVEALEIILDMLSRAHTDAWELPVSYDLVQKETEAQEVLYQMWCELGGGTDA